MSTKYYQKSLKFKVLDRIKQLSGNVVLRKEIADMGSPRQISRCLKDLIAMGELVKIGYGIYAKAYTSKYTDTPLIKGGIDSAMRDALKCLGIAYEPGSAERKYNEGKSTQVPVKNIVKLKNRCRRCISYKNSRLIF